MNTEQKRELLAKFVAGEWEIRYYLQKPIRQDGYLFATNGHILVRVEDDPAIEALQSGVFDEVGNKPPDCAKLFATAPTEFQPLAVTFPPVEKCEPCNGTGKVYQCRDCDGKGEFDHGTHAYECKECDGAGYADSGDPAFAEVCVDCNGTGEDGRDPIPCGGQEFALRYLKLLLSIGCTEIAVSEDDGRQALFRFPGGDGLLMPMRRRK